MPPKKRLFATRETIKISINPVYLSGPMTIKIHEKGDERRAIGIHFAAADAV